ncbi:hypothetical protein F5Y18DRAFT_390308 [Xylariaceae sp. FL1019]|nr:hypothetical protein F5Y18DRAFT_390308 [Xylariaceae sp. FL1019]
MSLSEDVAVEHTIDFSIELVALLPDSPPEKGYQLNPLQWQAMVKRVQWHLEISGFGPVLILPEKYHNDASHWCLTDVDVRQPSTGKYGFKISSPIFSFMDRDRWQIELEKLYLTLVNKANCEISLDHDARVHLYPSRDRSSPDINTAKLFADMILRFNFWTRLRDWHTIRRENTIPPHLKQYMPPHLEQYMFPPLEQYIHSPVKQYMLPPLKQHRFDQKKLCQRLRPIIRGLDSVERVGNMSTEDGLSPGDHVSISWEFQYFDKSYCQDMRHRYVMKATDSRSWENLARSVDVACLLLREAQSQAGSGWLDIDYSPEEELKPDALYKFMKEQLEDLRDTSYPRTYYPREYQSGGRKFIDEEIAILEYESANEVALFYGCSPKDDPDSVLATPREELGNE